jgi:hypothetical protein
MPRILRNLSSGIARISPIVLSPAAIRDFRIKGEKRTISINVSSGRLRTGSNIVAAHFPSPSAQLRGLPFGFPGGPSEPSRVQFGRVRIAPQCGANECPRLAGGDQTEESLVFV